MNAEGGPRLEKQARKRSNNWVITVECRNDQHQEIILATIAKRAYQLFERRGNAHGFDLDDWITAEKELLQNDFNGNTSQFDLFIESPRDPKATTVLSVTTQSVIVFHSHARHAGEAVVGPAVASVHAFPEEIATTKTTVSDVA